MTTTGAYVLVLDCLIHREAVFIYSVNNRSYLGDQSYGCVTTNDFLNYGEAADDVTNVAIGQTPQCFVTGDSPVLVIGRSTCLLTVQAPVTRSPAVRMMLAGQAISVNRAETIVAKALSRILRLSFRSGPCRMLNRVRELLGTSDVFFTGSYGTGAFTPTSDVDLTTGWFGREDRDRKIAALLDAGFVCKRVFRKNRAILMHLTDEDQEVDVQLRPAAQQRDLARDLLEYNFNPKDRTRALADPVFKKQLTERVYAGYFARTYAHDYLPKAYNWLDLDYPKSDGLPIAVLLASSGTGKTFISETYTNYADGDKVIAAHNGWPAGEWWTAPDADATIEKVWNILIDHGPKDKIILFGVPPPPSVDRGVDFMGLVIVTDQVLTLNAARRARRGVKNQPVDAAALIEGQRHMAASLESRKLFVFDGFPPIA
jgi:hypothetical protein